MNGYYAALTNLNKKRYKDHMYNITIYVFIVKNQIHER